MGQKLKIALLGGGSLYFESAMKEIAMTPELAGSELVLFDPTGGAWKSCARWACA